MPSHRVKTAVLVALMPFVFGACGLLGPDDSESPLINQIDRARAIWDTAGSSSYTLLATRACDCPIDAVTVTIDVVDDEITGVMHTDTNEPIDAGNWGQYATLDDLFDIARDAAQRKVPVLSILYHPDYAYISQIIVNYDLTRSNDDFIYTIEAYTPAPVP